MKNNNKKAKNKPKKNSNKILKVFDKVKAYFKKYPLTTIEVAILFLIPFAYLLSRNLKIDNDGWFLLNHGKYVLEHGIPHIEPFTMHSNFKFVMQQWLFSTIFYKIYNDMSGTALIALFLIINVLIIIALYRLCVLVSNKNYLLSAIITVISNCLLIYYSFFATRPHMVTYLILILFIFLIEKYFKTGHIRYLFLLPLLSLLEINLHASMWLFLYIFSGTFLIEALVDKFFYKRKNEYSIPHLILFLSISFAAGFINPYGIDAITYFLHTSNRYIGSFIIEMKPIGIMTTKGLIIVAFMVLNVIFMIREYGKHKYLRTSYFCILFGTFLLALNTEKGSAYFLIFALYPLCYYARNKKYEEADISLIRGIIFIFLFVFLSVVMMNKLYEKIDYKFVEQNISGALRKIEEEYNVEEVILFTDYYVGAEAEYRGFKSYIDARAEVFYKSMNGKEDIFDEYYRLYNNYYSEQKVNEIFEKRGFTHLIITNIDKLFKYKTFDNYTFVDSNGFYKLYVRNDIIKNKEEAQG